MIPAIDPTTGNLPPGVHEGTWADLAAAFGTTTWRRHLLSGLRAALAALQRAGCTRAYVDGSFVTAKEQPGDFDGCWEAAGVDVERLDEVLLDLSPGRAAQKAKYYGELFPVTEGRTQFLEFFQHDKHTGEPKGIVAIDLRAFA